MKFYDLDLDERVLDALDAMRFDECTPIQEHSIPALLEGRDLIGVAQTGTGKTAAYLLPILSKLCSGDYPKDAVNCVIMSPTRELAQQIDQAMEGFSYYIPVSSVAVYGGNDGVRYEQERKGMALGADIIIATPGRLISHLSLGNIDLSKVSFFILDEADRMLDMGFSEDIMKIASFLPKERQTIMFSATMPADIQKLATSLLINPVEVKLAVSKPADNIKQSAYICYETQKLGIIKSLFSSQKPERVLVFASSKIKVKDVAAAFRRMNLNADEMHSDLTQAERDEVMFKFRSNHIDVLVATDIVARGIDIDDIQMVINFDVPHDSEDYVHRIGRTARANKDGIAITFVSEKEQSQFRQIEKFLGYEITKNPVPEELGAAPAYDPHRKIEHGNDRNRGRGRDNRDDRGGRRNRNDDRRPRDDRRNGDTPKDQNGAETERKDGRQQNDNRPNGERRDNRQDRQPRDRQGNRNGQRTAPQRENAQGQQPNDASARQNRPQHNNPRSGQRNEQGETNREGRPNNRQSEQGRERRNDPRGGNRPNNRRQNQPRPQQNAPKPESQNKPQAETPKKKGFFSSLIDRIKGNK